MQHCYLTQTQTLILIDYTLSHLVSFWGTHTIFKVIYNWPNKTSYRRTIQTKSLTLRTNEVCRFAKNENKTAGLNQLLCFTNYQWIDSRRWSALVLNRQNMPYFHFSFINIDILLLPQVRINALNTLYQFPLSDELTSKNSDGIRKGLLAALADEDEQLAVCSNLCFPDKILGIFFWSFLWWTQKYIHVLCCFRKYPYPPGEVYLSELPPQYSVLVHRGGFHGDFLESAHFFIITTWQSSCSRSCTVVSYPLIWPWQISELWGTLYVLFELLLLSVWGQLTPPKNRGKNCFMQILFHVLGRWNLYLNTGILSNCNLL